MKTQNNTVNSVPKKSYDFLGRGMYAQAAKKLVEQTNLLQQASLQIGEVAQSETQSALQNHLQYYT